MASTASQLGIKAPSGGFENQGWYPSKTGGSYQYDKASGTFGESGKIHANSPQQGAGQLVSREVVNQSDPLRGQAIGTNWNYLHGSGKQPSSREEVNPYLDNFQNSAFASEGAVPTKGRSADEIKSMLTPDMAKPEQFSSAQEFAKLRESKGVQGLEDKMNELTAQEDEEVAFFRKQRFDERGKPVAMGVIEGRISEEENAAAERMDFIGRQKARINDQLTTSYNVINMMMGFMEGDYNRASDAYNSEFDRNLKVYDIVRGEERDARSDFESDRANASANLTTYMNAVTKGNLNYGGLDSTQKLMIQKLEIQSGMPQGFVSQLQMSPGDKLVSFNDKTGEALMVGSNGGLQVIQTGMRSSPTSESKSDIRMSQTKLLSSMMVENSGNDGYVDPEHYRNSKAIWTKETGGTIQEFDAIFQQYANPNHLGSYGIATKDSTKDSTGVVKF